MMSEYDDKEQEKKEKKRNEAILLASAYYKKLSAAKKYPLYYQGVFYLWNGIKYEAEPEIRDKVIQFLRTLEIGTSYMATEVLSQLRNLAYEPISKHPSMPFYADRHDANFPADGDVVAYRNGLLDVKGWLEHGGALRPHTHLWCSTICLPYAFDAAATCPQWLSFLDSSLGDSESISLLQEWFGYCLTSDTQYQKFMMLVGVPRAGKGTINRILELIVGEENRAAFDLRELAEKFGKASLIGKSIAIVPEADISADRNKMKIIEQLKSIVGEDSVAIERKYIDGTTSVRLNIRFHISCNQIPALPDVTGALSARMLLIVFRKSFEKTMDTGLMDKLLPELAGINRWALDGLVRLRKQKKFTIPEISRQELKAVRLRHSAALDFVQQYLVVRDNCDPGNLDDVEITSEKVMIGSGQLKEMFDIWKEDEGIEKTFNYFCQDLRALLPNLKVSRCLDALDKKIRIYKGIGKK
jgi:P4 family phage/plasmid primase-like protien